MWVETSNLETARIVSKLTGVWGLVRLEWRIRETEQSSESHKELRERPREVEAGHTYLHLYSFFVPYSISNIRLPTCVLSKSVTWLDVHFRKLFFQKFGAVFIKQFFFSFFLILWQNWSHKILSMLLKTIWKREGSLGVKWIWESFYWIKMYDNITTSVVTLLRRIKYPAYCRLIC